MQQGDKVWIIIKNFKKFKGRKDVKNNSWFRCSNRILEDQDFYDFTHSEFCVWIYVLCLVSEQNSAQICMNIRRAENVARLEKSTIFSALKKLKEINVIVEYDTRPLRARYVDDTQTERERAVSDKQTEQTRQTVEGATSAKKTELEALFRKNGEAEPEDPAPQTDKSFEVIDEFRNDDFLEPVLRNISTVVQRNWVKKYELSWLKEILHKAIEYHLADLPEGHYYDDWGQKLVTWVRREKNPHLVNPSLYNEQPMSDSDREKYVYGDDLNDPRFNPEVASDEG